MSVYLELSGRRSSPRKNTATVPGPQWEAMMVPMSQMRTSPSMWGKRSFTAAAVISASSRQLEWHTKHLPD